MRFQVTKSSLLLVLPPQHWLLEGFSSGLVALASYLSGKMPEAEVRVLDLSHTSQNNLKGDISKALDHFNSVPFIGITTTTASYQSALATAAVFKQLSPTCKIILGGPHTKAQDTLILEQHRNIVDFIAPGEGEVTLLKLLKEYPDLTVVPGLTYLSADGRPVRNHQALPLGQPELDELSVDFPGIDVTSTPGKFDHVTYVSARGCPLRCSFCAVANERIRAKSIPCIIKDLRHLCQDLGYSKIAIEDNFFAHSPERTLALCEAITVLQRDGVEFSWDCQTRVESMRRPDILAAMAKANCEAVYLGVEALEEKQLLHLGKTSNPRDYLFLLEGRVMPQLINSPVNCYINLQLGIPGETDSDWEKTLRRLSRLGQIASAKGKTIVVFPQLYVVYPGTRHFAEGMNNGRFPDDIFESFTAWEYHETPIRRFLGEEFAHGTGGIPEGIVTSQSLRNGRDFQIRLEAALRIIRQLRDMDEVQGVTVFRYGRYLVKDESEGVVSEDQMIVRLLEIAA